MRKPAPAAVAALVALSGVVAIPAVAAPGDPTASPIGEPQLLTLTEAGGASGWATKSASALSSQGYAPAKVGAAHTGGGVTVNAAQRKVTVAGTNLTANSAVAEAAGSLAVTITNGAGSITNTNGLKLTSADVVAGLPLETLNVTIDGKSGTFTLDWATGVATATKSTGTSQYDKTMTDRLSKAWAEMAPKLGSTIADGGATTDVANLVKAWVATPQTWNLTADFPFTFGTGFQNLTSGKTATLDPAAAVAASWLKDVSGTGKLSGALSAQTWQSVVPAAVATKAKGTPAETRLAALKLQDVIWAGFTAQGGSAIDQAMGSLASRATTYLNGEFSKQMAADDTASKIKVTPVALTSAATAKMKDALVAAAKTHLASDWKTTMLSRVSVTGDVQRTLTATTLKSIVATDVVQGMAATPTPTKSATTPTPTKSTTPTSTRSATPTPTKAATPTPTPAKAATPTPTPTKSATPTSTPAKAATPTPTPTKAATPAPIQAAACGAPKLSQTTWSADASQATRTITVRTSAECPWTVYYNSYWLTVSATAGVSGAAVTVTAQDNTAARRVGTVTFTSGGQSVSLNVAQAAASPTCEVSATTWATDFEAGASTAFTVRTNQSSWTVTVPALKKWAHASAAGGSDGGSFTLSVDQNTGKARNATVKVKCGG
ncbi:MAG: hypothetical protein LBS56_04250, partial [Propionibacteriaceae bacterium]|nr:hypothetical protein [Propionibacteriaceae bacterium]